VIPAELVTLACCDLGAVVRGRSIFASDLREHLERGVGWVPANQALTPLGPVSEDNPFGSTGDLRLLPDPDAHARVGPDERLPALDLLLSDIVTTDGSAWDCCTRTLLRSTLAELERELGVTVRASFEHEFQLLGGGEAALPFSVEAQRRAAPFAALAMAALAEAGLQPERVFAEYAPHQFEIPLQPADGVASADRAVLFREVVREAARRAGTRATFVPLLDPEQAGNGVHVHLSLLDGAGRAALYDESRPERLSELGGRFAAGILEHARGLSALTAPTPVSAARLRPHHWSAGAVCLAARNREALVRIPALVPLGGSDPSGQMRLEYRGADAGANPYLALGAILRAGLDGVRRELPPPPMLDRDPALLEPADAERFGVGALPATLAEALEELAADELLRSWLGSLLHDAYASVKRAEIEAARELDEAALCTRYARIY
jgi:glutamine synthetase